MGKMKYCCESMNYYLELHSELEVVEYNEVFREYVLTIPKYLGGGGIKILHCPWCGLNLPKILRDEWFGVIESLGLEVGDSSIPLEFKSDKWWKARSL